VTSTARALANREPLDVTSMSISELIVALSATEDRRSEWRCTGSPPVSPYSASDRPWVTTRQARIVRELRSRRPSFAPR